MKLLVTDLDGTLIQQHKIEELDLIKIQYFKDLGNSFIFATGRPLATTRHLISLCQPAYAICCGGAVIFKDEKCLFKESIDNADLEIIKSLCSENYFNFGSNGDFIKNIWEIDSDCCFISITAKDETLEPIIEIKEQIEALNLNVNCIINRIHLDITSKNVNKGFAIKKLCNILNIDKDQVYVVGDNNNDIPMCKEFYDNSYAISSGTNELKKVAKYVVDNVGDIITEEDFNIYK